MLVFKMEENAAAAFVAANKGAKLWSMSGDGMRRVKIPDTLADACIAYGGVSSKTNRSVVEHDCLTCEQKRLGDAIKDRLVEETRDTTVCDECQAEIDRLNTMTADEVLEEAPALADRITERAKTKAKSVIHRTAAAVLPGIVSSKVQGWIEDVVAKSEQ